MSKKLTFDFLASNIWALEDDFLQRMAKVAMREEIDPIQALEAKSGKRISNLTELRGDVAVIHVSGVISRYANLFHAICGGVSTELLSKEFNQALENKSVKAIVLNVDSPGGEASGIHELGEMIYQARGRKPIQAYVGGMGCSAAYWIASACEKLTLDATATVGSIGVVASVVKRDDPEGQTSYEFVSSQSPNKRLNIDSEEGQQAMQSQLDKMADVFIDRVARNMGVKREMVLSDFGRGAIIMGKDAVDRGMANELGSLEGVIASLSKSNQSYSSSGAVSQGTNSLQGLSALSAAVSSGDTEPEFLANVIREQLPGVAAFLQSGKGSGEVASSIGAQAALDMAESVELPSIARKLSNMIQTEAESYIANAQSLRDTLAAAGLSGSFDYLLERIDNPAALVGLAIHEAKAAQDESGDGSRHIISEEHRTRDGSSFNPKNIYATRSNANK
ncbi:S49 family peptidase [Vibrio albus]|uniref:S49 family peptidase n=1 Tax=Vibrio albus TaxID=2200953 RepID=A0A2U3B8H1_9VIBR|nr:S49 family peptidase [Vibrio albus]PWI33067.1 S49 family peptidase [Vibrio albus]